MTHVGFGGRASGAYSAVDDGIAANEDCNGHGTHVAGIVGSAPWGVAKNVAIRSVKVLGCDNFGTWSDYIEGLDWIVANGVKPAVINASIGGPYDIAAGQAIDRTINAGFVFVGAAGNWNDDACYYIPGGVAQAIVVGSADPSDFRAYYSNWGNCVDLFAPGDGIASAWAASDTGSEVRSGTSMASPHVAGAAALYLQRFPTANPLVVATEIWRGTTKDVLLDIPADTSNALLFSPYLGDTVRPTVTLTNPANGSTVSGVIAIAAAASDNVELQRVRFFRGNTLIVEDATAPYGLTWDSRSVADGTYTVRAEALDLAGQTGSSTASIAIRNGIDRTLPMISIVEPVSGDSVRGTVTIRANATDDIAIARVEFIVDGITIGTDASAPYAATWNTTAVPEGVHTLLARAFDSSGNNKLSDPIGVEHFVSSEQPLFSSMQIRLVAGTETVNPFGYTQAAATRDGKLYLVQCSGTCDSQAGVIREFNYDLAANTITATGLVMTLADSGWTLLHPTSLAFDPTNSNVAWVGNSLGSERAYYKIDWAKMKAHTPGKFVRRVAEDRATPGTAGAYVRPEFVQHQGTWYMAVAAYQYTSTPFVVRLYNRAAMDVAARTSEAAVFTPGNSFTVPTQLTQNLHWDHARGVLTLVQNQTAHGRNGRFVYVDLAASLASGTAVQIGNTYQNWSSPTRGGTLPTGTLESYRLLSSTKGIVVEDSKSYFVNLDVQEAEPGELSRSGWTGTASPLNASYPPARMLDGDLGTKYSSGRSLRPGDYFSINMGAPRTFSRIVMNSGTSTCDYARGYEVYVSSDGANWGAPVATGTPTASPVTVTFPTQTRQYFKVVQTGTSGCWWTIAELKVFASGSGALSRSGWTGSASPLSTAYPPSKMLDGNLTTKYSSGRTLRPGDFFTIDMQAPRTFSRIVMDSGSSTCDYARQYQVYVSDNGTTWGTPIATGTASASPVTATFPTQTHRHFKVVQTGSHPNCWWTIAELNVFP